jgi:hypothetical protein
MNIGVIDEGKRDRIESRLSYSPSLEAAEPDSRRSGICSQYSFRGVSIAFGYEDSMIPMRIFLLLG